MGCLLIERKALVAVTALPGQVRCQARLCLERGQKLLLVVQRHDFEYYQRPVGCAGRVKPVMTCAVQTQAVRAQAV
jgi:hypothetical protein